MKNFSLTHAGILVAVASVVLTNVGFSEACSTEITTQVSTLVGLGIAWFGRYRQGDVTLFGLKKA